MLKAILKINCFCSRTARIKLKFFAISVWHKCVFFFFSMCYGETALKVFAKNKNNNTENEYKQNKNDDIIHANSKCENEMRRERRINKNKKKKK